jgi:hypothetical protein
MLDKAACVSVAFNAVFFDEHYAVSNGFAELVLCV